jgi:hypothetical protein
MTIFICIDAITLIGIFSCTSDICNVKKCFLLSMTALLPLLFYICCCRAYRLIKWKLNNSSRHSARVCACMKWINKFLLRTIFTIKFLILNFDGNFTTKTFLFSKKKVFVIWLKKEINKPILTTDKHLTKNLHSALAHSWIK